MVNNLCIVVDCPFQINANLARFKRENKTGRGKEGRTENGENIRHKFCTSSNAGSFGNGKSFVSVVKKINKESETEFVPSIVLDDECLNKKDLSMSLMGRVKEMASLANLKRFYVTRAKELFRKNAGAGSWFSVLHLANDECVPDGRLAWVEVGGVPFKLWTVKTFSRIASKWGDLMDVDEDELNYHSKRLCVFTKVRQNIQESFKVNFRGKVHWVRAIEVPGWIPEFNDEEEEDDVSDECNFDGKPEAQEENNIFEESEEEKVQETEFGVPSGEKVNEEDHSLSHPPGFTPEVDQFEGNAMGDIAEKVYTEKENDVNSFVNKDIGNNDSNSVNNNVEPTDLDAVLNYCDQETKMGTMDLNTVRSCWGNSIFEYVQSDSVGYSGGIFVGVLLKSGIDLLDSGRLCSSRPKKNISVGKFDNIYQILGSGRIYKNGPENRWEAAPGNKDNAIRSFMGKLKFLKDRIRVWLSIHKANSRSDTDILKEELRLCDELIDKGMGSSEVVQNRLEILNKIHQVQKNQASEISQKAKIKWAIEGDENVKFFHGILNKKRSQSQIRGVMANGVWIDDPVKVKDEFLMHFRSRFDKPLLNRALLDLNFTNSLTNEQKEDLEQDITKEEVKRAVWDCGVDKSPGPDGFSFYFYRHFWSMIEDDVFGAVEYFFINGDIPNGCNSNFIALIPKIIDANMVKDFRPITDRQILDGPFILNEVLQWCRKKRKHALIFKVDFEKAYDSVRWDFLDDVLDKVWILE
ncbi:hypothetical protein Tco_0884906 [Tanacetum coccineum]